MVRKCRATALLELARDVRVTSSHEFLTVKAGQKPSASASSKKRKFDGSHEFGFPSSRKTRRRVKVSPSGDNLVPASVCADQICSPDQTVTNEDRIFTSDHESASCCSSNGSTTRRPDDERNIQFADLERRGDSVGVGVEASMFYSRRGSVPDCASIVNRREAPTSPWTDEIGAVERDELSGDLDSPARPSSPSEANSRRKPSTEANMPSEMELEDFFAEAEKKLQKQFAAKYNYDIVKDMPLEGRYEWDRSRP